jgi:hypothetical protein
MNRVKTKKIAIVTGNYSGIDYIYQIIIMKSIDNNEKLKEFQISSLVVFCAVLHNSLLLTHLAN